MGEPSRRARTDVGPGSEEDDPPGRAASGPLSVAWVILTQGNRPAELQAAIGSLQERSAIEIVVVQNGGDAGPVPDGVRLIESADNLGVPGGRDLGLRATDAAVVGFLDDDARLLTPDATDIVAARFSASPDLGAIAFRIVDDTGSSLERHVPRIGGAGAARGGLVATFLGGACAVRRSAYHDAGGYWPDLFYSHEELELSWRLHDVGNDIAYEPDLVATHPHTPISRHEDGWRLTGRNRVLIARRTLPWPIAAAHVMTWLVAGALRAPNGACRSAYLRGWRSGWSIAVVRRPIRWRTVWRLTRLGRPPIV